MTFFKRNKIASFFLLVYLLWWVFMAWYIFLKAPPAKPGCDLSPVVFIYLTPVLTILFLVVFLTIALVTKGARRKDYLVFTALVILPLLPGALYLMSIT